MAGTRNAGVVYAPLQETLREAISSGELRPGGAIPGENALAERHGISRSSVRLALGELEKEGLIVKRPGKGSFVHDGGDPAPGAILTLGMDVALDDTTTRWYGPLVLQGVKEVCDQAGCRVAFCGGPSDCCRKGFYDGVILLGAQTKDFPAIERLPELGVYPALVNRLVASPEVSYVAVDYRRESELAAASLFDAGCRRVALISGDVEEPLANRPRLDGFRDAAQARGMTAAATLHVVPGFQSADFYTDDLQAFLQRDGFDAVYLLNGSLALPLFAALDRLGVNPSTCPKLLCFDDVSYLAPVCRYPFAYVKMPLRQMGRDAATHLLERIRGGKQVPALKKIYQAELVSRTPNPGAQP